MIYEDEKTGKNLAYIGDGYMYCVHKFKTAIIKSGHFNTSKQKGVTLLSGIEVIVVPQTELDNRIACMTQKIDLSHLVPTL